METKFWLSESGQQFQKTISLEKLPAKLREIGEWNSQHVRMYSVPDDLFDEPSIKKIWHASKFKEMTS